MMQKYGDLMASVGEFLDERTGRQAKRQIKCGVVMRDDASGKFSIKMDSVPISPEWSGWLSVKNVETEQVRDPDNPEKEHNND